MGTVYLAERAGGEFVQRVAIKVVRGSAADDLLLRRFLEERRSSPRWTTRHRGLIDGGATLGLPSVVMEDVDGLPIDVYCESQRRTQGHGSRCSARCARPSTTRISI